MKKIVFYGLAASMAFGAPAFAEATDASLTTKGYVDSGLRALYSTTKNVTDGLDGRIDTLEGYIGTGDNPATGLRKDVADLKDVVLGTENTDGLADIVLGNESTNTTGLVDKVQTLESTVGTITNGNADVQAYTAGTNGGITISNHQVSITGLADTKSEANKDDMYIFKDGTLEKMSVADTWDTNFNFAGN